MNQIDWNDIKALLAAANEGSLSAAAVVTGVSQPTLGRRIDGLEASLGLTLFNRGPRGMTLTTAGMDLLEHAEAMQDAAARLSLAASGRAETLEGVVRLTAPKVMSTYHLPNILTRLLDEEPGLEIELVASDTTENLLRREADIAIRMYRPDQADLITRKVTDIHLGLYAADSYIAAHGLPTAETIGQHRMVGYDRSPLITDWIRAQSLPIPASGFQRLRMDDQVAYWRMVVAGAGIGSHQRSVGDAEPGVQRVLAEVPLPVLPVWLTVHAEVRTSALIRRVYDHLAAALAQLT